MTETNSSSKIVIVLVQQPILGYLLIPYTATKEKDGTYSLIEQAFHISSKTTAEISKAEQEAIKIASSYTEKNLMKVYSKEKNIATFLKKTSEEYVKNTIRPFIEKKLLEMIALIRTENLPLFQNQLGNKTLYKHHRLKISAENTELFFNFEADQKLFHYSLNCYRNGEPIALREKKPAIAIIGYPATLLLGSEIYTFHDIHASRILPFTNKQVVSVSITLLDKYLENIVMPIATYHAFTQQGLPIYKEQRTLKAILTPEESLFYGNTLRLTFQYGDTILRPEDNPPKITLSLLKDETGTALHYFYRDLTKEVAATKLLESLQLTLVDSNSFMLSKQYNLTEWILQHKETLAKHFTLANLEKKKEYALDEIRIEQDIAKEEDWFELRITVVIGNFRIPFTRFRKHIAEGIKEYTLPDGRLVLLPEEWFSKYSDLMEYGNEENDKLKIKERFAGIVHAIVDDELTKKTYFEKTEATPPPKLKATLRKYQQEGYNWLLHLHRHNLGGCLADDMGLGKTLQTLALFQHLYSGQAEKRPATLIVMPTSLLHNWQREIRRFTALSVYEYTGHNTRNFNMAYTFGCHNLILTTYGMMRNNMEALSKYRFEYVVLDESQNIKNSTSFTFKAAIQLQSNHRLVLTGTPIENSLKDLWSQFYFLQPELLGSESDFTKHFMLPIKQGNPRIESRLQKLITPYILRRSKEEVAPELPALTEEIIYCGMTEEQHDLYNKEKNKLRNLLLETDNSKEKNRSLTALNGITLLRQLASHPRMVFPDYTGESGKLEEIIATFETLRSEGHKVLIFSAFVKHLDLIANAFNENGWEYALLTGSTVNRKEEIARFSENKNIQAFLISLKAGGVGLNITEADYVFIIDPWWNPAAEMQAIGRSHRIGQQKRVFAYRFITEESIEGKIIRLQESKRKLSETFITDNNPFQSLTDSEWESLLK
ncbi:DEAD/DEAH box helicase [Bacteroides sp. 214]|uniref:DEAD/DEAH box helicase n=1 Tax=Bacteroides sp. 214 TaxID=2302935 RepID=UPI0013D48811|nr:DEAD/DEAH box helicase [Bacteroides sp. 214]NDW12092.1 DEAD/DEAH box helicase [Bacteroides sp. 214]